jgi:hypothetical protein
MQLVDIGTGELCRSRVTLCEKRIVKQYLRHPGMKEKGFGSKVGGADPTTSTTKSPWIF